jgi:hypothetical protein
MRQIFVALAPADLCCRVVRAANGYDFAACPLPLRHQGACVPKLADPVGLEPTTLGLEDRCSIHLSYGSGDLNSSSARARFQSAFAHAGLAVNDGLRGVLLGVARTALFCIKGAAALERRIAPRVRP